MHIHITNIEWDTDGEAPEKCGLPSEGWFELPHVKGEDVTDDVIGELTDMLTDKYGYLIKGYRYEVGQK